MRKIWGTAGSTQIPSFSGAHTLPLIIIQKANLIRIQDGPILTTVGTIAPLTFERYRLCELFAELLHCSNMALLNRSTQYSHLYDSEGRLQSGLAGLEELAQVIALNNGDERDHDAMDETQDETEPALELPISRATRDTLSMDSDSDMSGDDEPGSSDDDAMEEIVMYEEPQGQLEELVSPPLSGDVTTTVLPTPPITVPSSPNAASLPSPSELAAQGAGVAVGVATISKSPARSTSQGTIGGRSHGSRRSSKRMATLEALADTPLPIGERLKLRLLDIGVLSTVLVRSVLSISSSSVLTT